MTYRTSALVRRASQSFFKVLGPNVLTHAPDAVDWFLQDTIGRQRSADNSREEKIMAVTITRQKDSGTPAATNGASGRTPANRQVKGAPTQGDLGTLRFSVSKGSVPTTTRGRAATVEIPTDVKNSFIQMLEENPQHDADSMAKVGPITLTNKQITQWLKNGATKWEKDANVVDPNMRGWVKSSVVTAEGSPNKQSTAKEDADKPVTVVWVVRFMSEAEHTAKVNRQRERESAE